MSIDQKGFALGDVYWDDAADPAVEVMKSGQSLILSRASMELALQHGLAAAGGEASGFDLKVQGTHFCAEEIQRALAHIEESDGNILGGFLDHTNSAQDDEKFEF